MARPPRLPRPLPPPPLRGRPAGAGRAGYGGRNQRPAYHRLFGGQLLGQFVRYEVERHHEGRAFATASASLHAAEDGPALQTADPVPAVPGEEHRVFGLIPWEARTTADLDSPKPEAPELELWLRSPDPGPDAEAPAPALTAYATDLTLIGTALRPVDGVSQRDAGTAFTSAVTSHTLWFHRPFRTDDWLLLRQHSPLFAHARSFGRGDVLTADGVASYAQESLLRFRSRTRNR